MRPIFLFVVAAAGRDAVAGAVILSSKCDHQSSLGIVFTLFLFPEISDVPFSPSGWHRFLNRCHPPEFQLR